MTWVTRWGGRRVPRACWVAPVWLKSPRRVASLLWLYFVVELVQALVEREVRHHMRARARPYS